MKKKIIIYINLCDNGSSGTIIKNIIDYVESNSEFECLLCVPKSKNPKCYSFYKREKFLIRLLKYHIFKVQNIKPEGFIRSSSTNKLLKKINFYLVNNYEVLIHLHTLHHTDIYLPKLFSFIKKKNIPVIYTLHDSWSYTGGCYCYSYNKCYNWHGECGGCQHFYKNKDLSLYSLKHKQKCYEGCNITFVSVSEWLNSMLNKSIISKYKHVVIHGECNIKKKNSRDINLLRKLNAVGKHIILFSSVYWIDRKGVKFIETIVNKLPLNYIAVVIGKEFITLNERIINVGYIEYNEMNSYYSIADCYVSVSQDETLGLTLCESQICGIPVAGFGHCGTFETVTKKSGILLEGVNDINKLVDNIIYIVEKKPFSIKEIIESGNRFQRFANCPKYLDLYKETLK